MAGFNELAWIGCSDIAKGNNNWRWVHGGGSGSSAAGKPCGRRDENGEATYSNWRAGQPDKAAGRVEESCTMIWNWGGGMQWADYDCSKTTYSSRAIHFICEAPADVHVVKASPRTNVATLLTNTTCTCQVVDSLGNLPPLDTGGALVTTSTMDEWVAMRDGISSLAVSRLTGSGTCVLTVATGADGAGALSHTYSEGGHPDPMPTGNDNIQSALLQCTSRGGEGEGGGRIGKVQIYLQPGYYAYGTDPESDATGADVDATGVADRQAVFIYGIGTPSDVAAQEEADALVRAQCDCAGCYIDSGTDECRTEDGNVVVADAPDFAALSFAGNSFSRCSAACINAADDAGRSQCLASCWAVSIDSIMWFTRPSTITSTTVSSAWQQTGGTATAQLFDAKASSRVAAECRRFGEQHNNYVRDFDHGCTLAGQSLSTCFEKCHAHASTQSTLGPNEHQHDYESACAAACCWSLVAVGVENNLGVDSSSVKPWGVLKPQCLSVCAQLDEVLAKEGCIQTCTAALSDVPVLTSNDLATDYETPFKDGVFGGSSEVTQVAYAAKYCPIQFGTSRGEERDLAVALGKHPGCILAATWLAFKTLEQAHCTTAKGAAFCSGGASTSSVLSIHRTLSVEGSGTSLAMHNVVVEVGIAPTTATSLVTVVDGGVFRASNCAFRTDEQTDSPFQIVGSKFAVSEMIASSCIYRSAAAPPPDGALAVETVRAEENSLFLSCMHEHPSVLKTAITSHVIFKDSECDEAVSSAHRWRWDASMLAVDSTSTASCIVSPLTKLHEQFHGLEDESVGTGAPLSRSRKGLTMVHLASEKHTDTITFPLARDESYGVHGGHVFLVGRFSRIPAETVSDSFKLRRDRYTYVNTPRTWMDARRDCKSRGMDLVSIETEQEMQLIKSLVAQELGLDLETDEGQSRGYARSFCRVGAAAWTGCHRDDRGQWVWDGTGQSCGNGGSNAWNSVEKDGNEYCIHLWFCKKEWATSHCNLGTAINNYICEDNSVSEGNYNYVTEVGEEVFVCGAGDEESVCNCDGTVYYGKLYVTGNSGVRATYPQMMQARTGSRKVQGAWDCTQYRDWTCSGCGGDLGTDPLPNIQKQCYCVGKRIAAPAIFFEDTSATNVKVGEIPSDVATVGNIAASCSQPKDNWRFHHLDDDHFLDLPLSGMKYGAVTSQSACFYACSKDSRCKQAVYYKVGRNCHPMAEASNVDAKGGTNYDFISVHCNSGQAAVEGTEAPWCKGTTVQADGCREACDYEFPTCDVKGDCAMRVVEEYEGGQRACCEYECEAPDNYNSGMTESANESSARIFGIYRTIESKSLQRTPLQIEAPKAATGGRGGGAGGDASGGNDDDDDGHIHLWEIIYQNCTTDQPYAMFGLDGIVVGSGAGAYRASIQGHCSGFKTLKVGSTAAGGISIPNNFEFHFGELVVYATVLEESRRNQEVALLKAKWGIQCPSECHHCDGQGQCCYSTFDETPWRDECLYSPPRLNANSSAPINSLFTSLFKESPAQQETISMPNMQKTIFFTLLHGPKTDVTYRLAFGAKESAAREGHVPPAAEEFDAAGGPGAFFCHASSASITAVPYDVGSYRIWLIAKDTNANPHTHGLAERFAEVVVKVWDFEVKELRSESDLKLCNRKCGDSDNPLFGPNGMDCGPGRVVDDVPDDELFTCDCSAVIFSGDNCALNSSVVINQGSFDEGNDTGPVVGGLLGFLVVALVAVAGVFRFRAHKASMRAFNFGLELQRMVAAGEIDKDIAETSLTPREIKRVHVTLIHAIGSGQFGQVHKALLDESPDGGPPEFIVAVKTVISAKLTPEATQELASEATVMVQVGAHPNLVSIVGVVTRGLPLMLVVSFCEQGSLLSVLRDAAKDNGEPVAAEDKLRLSFEIGKGMAHLASKLFIHRDLAARNVLVSSGGVAKVADFGLSRGTGDGGGGGNEDDADQDTASYYRSSTGVFPVRWTSPESMETMKFTSASDVWSYGITLAEIYYDGKQPYSKMKNAEVIHKVQGGYRIPRPKGCPAKVYAVMLSCWDADARSRPRFSDLAGTLSNIVLESDGNSVAVAETDIDQAAASYLDVVATADSSSSSNTEYTAPVALAVPELGSRSAQETGIAITEYGATYNLATNSDESKYTLPAAASAAPNSRPSEAAIDDNGGQGYDMPIGYNDNGVAQVTEYHLAAQEGGENGRHSGYTAPSKASEAVAAAPPAPAPPAAPVRAPAPPPPPPPVRAPVPAASLTLPTRPKVAAPPPPRPKVGPPLPSAPNAAAPPPPRPKVPAPTPSPAISRPPAVARRTQSEAVPRSPSRPTPARRSSQPSVDVRTTTAAAAAAAAATANTPPPPVPRVRRRSAAATAAMSGEAVWVAAIGSVAGAASGMLPAMQASALLKETKLSNDVLKQIWDKAKTDVAAPSNLMSRQEFVAAYKLAVERGGHPIQAVLEI